MFKAIFSMGSNNFPTTNPQTGSIEYTYKYEIVDDDFIEDWLAEPIGQRLFRTTVRPGAIINCYESKQLDVAYNLVLYHKYMQQRYSWYELKEEFEYNIKWCPKYKNYVNQVKNYLNKLDSLKAFW